MGASARKRFPAPCVATQTAVLSDVFEGKRLNRLSGLPFLKAPCLTSVLRLSPIKQLPHDNGGSLF